MKYVVTVALVCYVGVVLLFLLWGRSVCLLLCPSLARRERVGSEPVHHPVHCILRHWLRCLYYATADMPIPMVADCSDYGTYRSGQYIPGIMGTLFQPVKAGLQPVCYRGRHCGQPDRPVRSGSTQYDPYVPGMNTVVIALFCLVPMAAWTATLISMKGYTLTGGEDERDPGRQRLPPGRCSTRHEAGRCYGQVADHGPAAGRVPELISPPFIISSLS